MSKGSSLSISLSWSKIILAAVLGLGLLAGVAYAGYWYGIESSKFKFQSSKFPSGTQTQVTPAAADETAGQQVYRSEKYDFEFKYPSDFHIRPDATEELTSFLEEPGSNASQKLILSISENPNNLDLREFVENNKPIPDDRTSITYEDYKTTQFEGLTERAESPCLGICEDVKVSKDYRVLIKGKRYVISFQAVNYDNPGGITYRDEIQLNQILSTFKFLDSESGDAVQVGPVVVEYMGDGSGIASDFNDHFWFRYCDNTISVCNHYLIPAEVASNFPILQDIAIGDQVKITGRSTGGGAATGNSYSILTSDIEIELQ